MTAEVHAFEQDLRDVLLRLLDAEWLDGIEGAPRIEAAIGAFDASGSLSVATSRECWNPYLASNTGRSLPCP